MDNSKFFVSKSDDGRTLVIKRPLEHVYVDLWDTSLAGVVIAGKIADLLNEITVVIAPARVENF